MIPDPTGEIKAIRHRMGAELGFDLHRIVEDTRGRQEESGLQYVRLAKKEPRITVRCTEAADRGYRENETVLPRVGEPGRYAGPAKLR